MWRDSKLGEIIRSIRDRLDIRHWIELGANEGLTLQWALESFEHVWGCETFQPRQRVLHEKFDGDPRVTLLDESCITALPKILDAIGDERAIVFDDAHWEDHWPLRDNLRLLKPKTNVVVLIHDAFVPGYPNFVGCYDGCGSADAANGGRQTPIRWDAPLDENLIRSVLGTSQENGPSVPLLWPNYPGDWLGWCIADLTGSDLPPIPDTFRTL